jgi:uncharacterized protein
MKLVKDNKSLKVQSSKFEVRKDGWILFFVAKVVLLFVLGFLNLNLIHAQNYPERPNPPRLVNDYIGLLSQTEQSQIERKLQAFKDSSSTSIAVVVIKTTDGADIAMYATELGEKWGLGSKSKDNGVLLVVAMDDRKINISPGRGAEEYLTDAICKRIITNVITPNFKSKDYYDGIDQATTVMIDRLNGQFINEEVGEKDGLSPFAIAIIIVFIILFIIFSNRFGGGGGTTIGRRGYRTGGGFGGFSGGGWSSGSSGGGFSGFGGGSFGGGGASGSW